MARQCQALLTAIPRPMHFLPWGSVIIFTGCFSGTDSDAQLKRCLSLARKAALITCPQSQLRVRQLVHFILQSRWILNGSTVDTCTWEISCGCSRIYHFCGEHANIGDSLAGSHYVRMNWLSCKVDGPMSHAWSSTRRGQCWDFPFLIQKRPSSCSLRHYPYWQCDRASCCLYQRVPLQFWCWRHTASGPPGTDCACSRLFPSARCNTGDRIQQRQGPLYSKCHENCAGVPRHLLVPRPMIKQPGGNVTPGSLTVEHVDEIYNFTGWSYGSVIDAWRA